MSYTVAIIAAGDMGSAVGARLGEHGVRVTTSLAGRSAASAARAEKARMVPVDDDDALVADADFFLSICPPGEAVALAQRMKPALARARKKPIYVDCNAVSPETAVEIGAVLEGTGCPLCRRRHHRPAAAARPHRHPHLRLRSAQREKYRSSAISACRFPSSTGRSAPPRR